MRPPTTDLGVDQHRQDKSRRVMQCNHVSRLYFVLSVTPRVAGNVLQNILACVLTPASPQNGQPGLTT
jgi:hypothetical protein